MPSTPTVAMACFGASESNPGLKTLQLSSPLPDSRKHGAACPQSLNPKDFNLFWHHFGEDPVPKHWQPDPCHLSNRAVDCVTELSFTCLMAETGGFWRSHVAIVFRHDPTLSLSSCPYDFCHFLFGDLNLELQQNGDLNLPIAAIDLATKTSLFGCLSRCFHNGS